MREKLDKKALLKRYKEQQQDKLRNAMLLTPEELNELLWGIEQGIDENNGCKHDFSIAERLLADKENGREIIAWLAKHSGNCDCEILCNLESDYGFILQNVKNSYF